MNPSRDTDIIYETVTMCKFVRLESEDDCEVYSDESVTYYPASDDKCEICSDKPILYKCGISFPPPPPQIMRVYVCQDCLRKILLGM